MANFGLDWPEYSNSFHSNDFWAFWKYLLLLIKLRALNVWKMFNTCKTPGKFCPNLWSQWTLTVFHLSSELSFLFLNFFLFLFFGNVLLSSETDLNHIRDPRSVLEWSYLLLVQNSAQYLLRVTSGGKIVRNFKILDHRFQNQVRSHNLGPSNIQNLPKYFSIQIKLALIGSAYSSHGLRYQLKISI